MGLLICFPLFLLFSVALDPIFTQVNIGFMGCFAFFPVFSCGIARKTNVMSYTSARRLLFAFLYFVKNENNNNKYK